MTKDQFRQLVNSTFKRIVDLTDTKGEEYSRSDDQLANFKRGATEAGISPEQVWLVFYNKHADAIKTFVRTGVSLSEPIQGRIDDAILYLILLKGLVHDEESRTPSKK